MKRLSQRWLGAMTILVAAFRADAAQPVMIDFEDIFHLPVNRDVLPPFHWRGVYFDGGTLRRTTANGLTMSWYGKSSGSSIQMVFPPGSTGISFDLDGFGQSILGWEFMPLQVWDGPIGIGTVVATIPPSPPGNYIPPKHRITVPDGGTGIIAIFTASAPSGVRQIGNAIAIDNIRYTPPDPDPTFAFDLPATSDQRVLIHKFGSDNYPSPLQTNDRKIRVEGTVTLGGQPAPGKTIYFRLKDPKDTAAYVQNAGDAFEGDNADGLGSLNGGGISVSAVSDGAGRISLTLEITDHVAGDNYQMEASPKASFSCAPGCPKSAVYTAWKRVYLEKKRMFRIGAYVTTLLPATAGESIFTVSDINQFRTGNLVRLIHAPNRFSLAGPPHGPADPQFTFYSEEHQVRVHAQPVTRPDGTVLPPHLELLPLPDGTPDRLLYSYGPDPSFEKVLYLSDAVGVVNPSGPAAYSLDDALIRPAFEKSLVEYVDLPSAVTEIPFHAAMSGAQIAHFPSKWADASVIRRLGADRSSRPNHQFIASGSKLAIDPPAPNGQPGAEFGQTPLAREFSRSWIWAGRISDATFEPSQPVFQQTPTLVLREVVVHELTHQWGVNASVSGANVNVGHCLEERYQNDGKYCLMHMPYNQPNHNPEWSDGDVDLHYRKVSTGDADSEYSTIRRAAEPPPLR